MKNYYMRKSFRTDFDILCHILRYCERIENIIERFGCEEEIFKRDMAYRDAVSMNLLQNGELAGHLSEDYRSQTRSEMNWSAIKSMRNSRTKSFLLVRDCKSKNVISRRSGR